MECGESGKDALENAERSPKKLGFDQQTCFPFTFTLPKQPTIQRPLSRKSITVNLAPVVKTAEGSFKTTKGGRGGW